MLKWFGIIVRTLCAVLHTHRVLATENLALRQQLAVLKQRHPRPRLTDADRLFWVILSRTWSDWRKAVHIVQPETVVRWHRQGFRYYWRWKSRHRGRPRGDPQVRDLIRRMCRIRSAVGRAANSRRVIEAWDRGVRGHGLQVHGQAAWTTIADLADIS